MHLSALILLTTVRFVYKYFFVIYKLSYTIGSLGYFLIMLDFLGFDKLWKPSEHS